MNTGPKGAITPLELLENQDIFAPSIISQWYNPVMAGVLGFVGSLLANYAVKRPFLSGIQRHVLVTAGSFVAIKYYQDRQERKMANRDAVFRHYIQLHPEDFPPFERKQYKDILEHWYPVR